MNGENSATNDAANMLGQITGLSCIAYALIRTHPQPEEFAHHMQNMWRWLDSPHDNPTCPPAFREGALRVLQLAEGGLRGSLGIRPPGQANRPIE